MEAQQMIEKAAELVAEIREQGLDDEFADVLADHSELLKAESTYETHLRLGDLHPIDQQRRQYARDKMQAHVDRWLEVSRQ